MKKIIFGIAIFLLCISNVSAIDITSEHAILYNMNDDIIVFEKDAFSRTPIASLTKIMTCIVSIENIDDLDEEVVVTDEMLKGLVANNLYVAGLKANQHVTYRDLLYVTFLPSGADGANSLAYLIGGTVENFVSMMNNKASELGLNNTHFANPTGLDDDNNYSTVDEVAKLFKYAISNETFHSIIETNSYELSDESFTVKSSIRKTSSMFKLDTDFIVGAKTGLTNNAGRCLASLAYDSNNDIYYILVTTKAPDSKKKPNHLLDAIKVYNYYFDNYKYYTLVSKGDLIKSLPVKYSKISNVNVKVDRDVQYYYNTDFDINNVSIEYNGIEELNPEYKVGDNIGHATILYNGIIVDTVELYLDEVLPVTLLGFIIMNKYLFILMLLLLITINLNLIKIRFKHNYKKNKKRK